MEVEVIRQQIHGGSHEFTPEQVAQILKNTKFVLPSKDIGEVLAQQSGVKGAEAELFQVDGNRLVFNPTGPDPLRMKGYEIDLPTEPGEAQKVGFAFGGQPILLDENAAPLPIVGFSVPGGPKFNVLEAMGLDVQQLGGGVIAPRLPNDPERQRQLRLFVESLNQKQQREQLPKPIGSSSAVSAFQSPAPSMPRQPSNVVTYHGPAPARPISPVDPRLNTPNYMGLTTFAQQLVPSSQVSYAPPMELPITRPVQRGSLEPQQRTMAPEHAYLDASSYARSIRPGAPTRTLPSVAPIPRPDYRVAPSRIPNLEVGVPYQPQLVTPLATDALDEPFLPADRRHRHEKRRHSEKNGHKVDRRQTPNLKDETAYLIGPKPNYWEKEGATHRRKEQSALCGADIVRYTQLAGAAFQQTQNWLNWMGGSKKKEVIPDHRTAAPRVKSHHHRGDPRYEEKGHHGKASSPNAHGQGQMSGRARNLIRIDESEAPAEVINRIAGIQGQSAPLRLQGASAAKQRSVSPPQERLPSIPGRRSLPPAPYSPRLVGPRLIGRSEQRLQQRIEALPQEHNIQFLPSANSGLPRQNPSPPLPGESLHGLIQRTPVKQPIASYESSPAVFSPDVLQRLPADQDPSMRAPTPVFAPQGIPSGVIEVPADLEGLPEIFKLACMQGIGAVAMPAITQDGETGPDIPTIVEKPTLLHPQFLNGGFTKEELAEAKRKAIAEGRIKEEPETGELTLMTPAQQIAFAQKHNAEELDAEKQMHARVAEAMTKRAEEGALTSPRDTYPNAEPETGAQISSRATADQRSLKAGDGSPKGTLDEGAHEFEQVPAIPKGPQGTRIFEVRSRDGSTREVECVTLNGDPKIELYRNFLDAGEAEELKVLISKVQALPYIPNNLLDAEEVAPRIKILLRRMAGLSKLEIDNFVAICPSILIAPSVDATRNFSSMFRVYLDEADPSFESNFVHLGISISPQQGSALLWNGRNERGIQLARALHSESGCPDNPRQVLTAYIR